jgi:transketolase
MTQEMMATRDAYGHALLELMEENENIVVLDADLSRSTRTEWVNNKYPARFYNMGIAEQNLIGVAAGMSMERLIPFATTYSIFIGRAFDQIRQAVAYMNSNVKIVATHAGLAASHDGGSHQSIEDICLMRVLPNMTIFSPCDYFEAKQIVRYAAEIDGPVYIRLQKEDSPVITDPDVPFHFGEPRILKEGNDLVVFSTGTVCAEVLNAANTLQAEKVSVCVVNIATIKPLNSNSLALIAEKFKCVVVVEEHSIIGGLYESICSALSQSVLIPIYPINIPDQFSETGTWDQLKHKFGLSSEAIVAKLKSIHLLQK